MTFLIQQADSAGNNVMRVGQTQTLEHAIMLTQAIIDEHLSRLRGHADSADAMYKKYQETGSVPSIFVDDEKNGDVHVFDSWNYASQRCIELCGENGPSVVGATCFDAETPAHTYRHPLSGAEFRLCAGH